MTTPGMRPSTEADLARRDYGALRSYAGEMLSRTAWVFPAMSFLLPLSLRRGLLRLAGLRIGAKVTGLKGVTIAEGTIIGAGAMVTKDCKPGALYVGVPARQVR